MRWIAAGLVEALRELVEVLRRRADLRPELAQVLDQRPRLDQGRAAHVERVAEAREGLARRLRERALGLDQAAEVGRRRVRRRSAAACPGRPGRSRSTISRRSCRRVAGQQLERAALVAGALGGRLAGLVGLTSMKSRSARARAPAARAPGRSRARAGRGSWFCLARIASTSSVSLSAGLARWMTSLRSSPRPARPVPSSLSRIAKRCR